MKTYVYVDGFNFYFGCIKGTPNKWLNIRQPCETLLPRNQATFYRHIRQGVLSQCLFPSPMADAAGTFHKPPTW